MVLYPSSTINLYAGVEIDNGEQLAFRTIQNQRAYFNAALQATAVDVQVIKKTGALRVSSSTFPASLICNCNYLSFHNPDFDDKTIYARIMDYEYVNNETVDLFYAIDYWQTWMFDLSYEECFIEREHLSEDDYAKAEINPYDPTILELKTGEDLPISKDLEKPMYEIGTGQNVDGSKLSDILSMSPHNLGVLIKISNIDFDDLDKEIATASDKPSYKFAAYLSAIAGTSLGFYYVTQKMANVMHTTNPSAFPTTDRWAVGSGWNWGGQNVYPFYGSSYRPQCCYIYDQYGAMLAGNYMSTFLDMMTTFTGGEPDKLIIDMTLIPNHLMFLGGRVDTGESLEGLKFGVRANNYLSVASHKLKRFPYSYERLIAPNGDVKEIQFEKFGSVQDGDDIAYFEMLLDISDKPVFIVSPINYKMSGINGNDTNILEAIYFDQFPTMPYTIDAFTAQVAAIANQTIGNRTLDSAADMANMDTQTNDTSQFIAFLGKAAGAISKGASAVAGGMEEGGIPGVGLVSAVAEGMSTFQLGAQQTTDRRKFNYAQDRWHSADSALTDAGGSEIANQLRLTRAAYACDKYFPSNGIGTTNFTYDSFCDIIALAVNLSSDVLHTYDRYFQLYGYKSGRAGLPRIIEYISGGSDLPHWEDLGASSGHKHITYVKTLDMKVQYSMIPVASYIKDMFDNGVRFIQGDA